MIEVTIITSDGKKQTRTFKDDTVTVGRGVGNDLTIEDSGVSRYHLRVSVLNGSVVLNDLNSSNGTFIDSEKVTTCELSPEDKVVLGNCILLFAYAGDRRRPESGQVQISGGEASEDRKLPRLQARETKIFSTDDIYAEIKLLKENPDAAIKQLERDNRERQRATQAFASSSWEPIQSCLEPLFPLLRDPQVGKIMLNGPSKVFYQNQEGLQQSDISIPDVKFSQALRMLSSGDEAFTEGSKPFFSVTLDDGSRITGTLPPTPTREGSLIILRPFIPTLSVVDLVANGTLSESMLYFLHASIALRKTILVAGPPGCGITSLCAALLSLVPAAERVVIAQNSSRIPVQHENAVSLDLSAVSNDPEKLAQLLEYAISSSPDRLIFPDSIPEAYGPFIQAACARAPGSIAGIEATSAEVALSRLESEALRTLKAGSAASLSGEQALRHQIRFGVQLIVELCWLPDGSRRISRIAEVAPLPDGSLPGLHDIFRVSQEPNTWGNFNDRYIWPPTFLGQLRAAGFFEAFQLFSEQKTPAADVQTLRR